MNDCIKTLKGIESVVSRFHDLMGDDAGLIITESEIKTSDSMQKDLAQIEDKNRLMQIGIVGRVKAGKSSLLNAMLFEGRSVLPKAATPMTAALTTLAYGKSLSAQVDFFSEEDIRDIHQKAAQYESALSKKTQHNLENLKAKSHKKTNVSEKELLEKAKKRAIRELKENAVLCACKDQSDRINKSGVDRTELEKASELSAENYDDLKARLLDYVAAKGRFMPFTKSVNVKLPLDVLKDVRVVDTPGVNDPVASREARTKDLLKLCDVVLVVSPAGQFMSNEDLELMDRIGSKEGVRELYVVASQVDNQLFGSEKKAAEGNLYDALSGISSKLNSHLKNTITKLKETRQEVGGTFDQLVDGSTCRVIHSSGISKTIIECEERSEEMDEGTRHVWGNLKSEYPDYFPEKDFSVAKKNLMSLANIEKVDDIIKKVKCKKKEILDKKTSDYLEGSQRRVEELKNRLSSAAKEREQKVRNSDLKEVEDKRALVEELVSKGSVAVDNVFMELRGELRGDVFEILKKEIDNVYGKSAGKIEGSEGSTTEREKREKSGVLSWGARMLWGGGYEMVTETYITVRTGAVYSALRDFTETTERALEKEISSGLRSWKRRLQGSVFDALRRCVDDEQLDVELIKKAVFGVIGTLDLPVIQLDQGVPQDLDKSGTLKGHRAEEYISSAERYLRDLKSEVNLITKAYAEDLMADLGEIKLSDKIFGKYRDDLVALEKQIENQELTLRELSAFEKELRNV